MTLSRRSEETRAITCRRGSSSRRVTTAHSQQPSFKRNRIVRPRLFVAVPRQVVADGAPAFPTRGNRMRAGDATALLAGRQGDDDLRRPRYLTAPGTPVAPLPTDVLIASINCRADPDKRAKLFNTIKVTLEKMRGLRACERCRLLLDAEHPDAFTLLSEWNSASEAEGFFNSTDFQGFDSVRTLLEEEPVLVLDEIASRVTRMISHPRTASGSSDTRSSSTASVPRRRT